AVLSALFLTSEALAIAVGLWAVRGPDHRHLRPWVPTLHVYFPLAALAAWKALHEVVTRPFYWDKTSHGAVDALPAAAPAAVTGPFTGPAAPPRPA
ncbi:MAG: glycosyl transferase, partial [Acidobacteriota bacterium]